MATKKATSVTKRTETVNTAAETVKEGPAAAAKTTIKPKTEETETETEKKPADDAAKPVKENVETKAAKIKAPEKKTPEKKTAAKESAAKKETAKKTTTAKKETAKKTTTAKKETAKKEIKVNAVVEHHGRQVDEKTIIANVKKAWTASGKKIGDIKTIELYIKPEENAVYYVVNGTEGAVALYE